MTSLFQLTLLQKFGPEAVIIHPTLIKTANSLVLFDACLPNQTEQLEEELRKKSCSIMDLTHIFVSHQDHDHIGSLAEIKRKNPNVEIIASELEEPYISGKETSLRIIQACKYNENLSGEELKWGETFVEYLKTIQPCMVDKTFANDSFCFDDDIKIISTPGHTPGHCSLFIKSNHALIAGDSLAVENNSLCVANPQFTLDMKTCKKTIRKIFQLKPEKIFCYHGGLVNNENNAKMKEFIDQIGA